MLEAVPTEAATVAETKEPELVMPLPVSEQLAKLAWSRLRADITDGRGFVHFPTIYDSIACKHPEWISSYLSIFESYAPLDPELALVPKAMEQFRPVELLHPLDELHYYCLVSSAYPCIFSLIEHTQGDPDCCQPLTGRANGTKWTKTKFTGWKNFDTKSIDIASEGFTHVLVADVAGYYENIDHAKLASDLYSVCPDEELVKKFLKCFKRWSIPREKGIPQGNTASDILAKLFMHSVDTELAMSGIRHLRYNDDFRLFFNNRADAKEGLLTLMNSLRRKGLNLQSAKTKIIELNLFSEELRFVKDSIKATVEQYNQAVRLALQSSAPSIPFEQEVSFLSEEENQITVDKLEVTFKEKIESNMTGFNKSLFHFLVKRLGKSGSAVAVKACIEVLDNRPEEAEYALDYLGDHVIQNPTSLPELEAAVLNKLGPFASSKIFLHYLCLRWLDSYADTEGIERALPRARQVLRDLRYPTYTRVWAISLIGKRGFAYDMESLQQMYISTCVDVERAEIVNAIRRMEKTRLNQFFGKIAGDSTLVDFSIFNAKRLKEDVA